MGDGGRGREEEGVNKHTDEGETSLEKRPDGQDEKLLCPRVTISLYFRGPKAVLLGKANYLMYRMWKQRDCCVTRSLLHLREHVQKTHSLTSPWYAQVSMRYSLIESIFHLIPMLAQYNFTTSTNCIIPTPS